MDPTEKLRGREGLAPFQGSAETELDQLESNAIPLHPILYTLGYGTIAV